MDMAVWRIRSKLCAVRREINAMSLLSKRAMKTVPVRARYMVVVSPG
jgi:hypothetical protein